MQAPVFASCSLKSHQVTRGWNVRQVGCCVFQGVSAPPGPQCWQRLGGAGGRAKLRERIPMTKSQTQRSFQNEGYWSAGTRIKGEVKGRETEKTEKEKEAAGKQS